LKQVLFDSHILLDVLLNRQPFVVASARALNTVATEQCHGYLSGHAVTNLYSILRRQLGRSTAHETLTRLLQRLQVASVTDSVIRVALQSSIVDFEDAVTHEAAKAADLELIVTRNISDFAASSIAAILPANLLEALDNGASNSPNP